MPSSVTFLLICIGFLFCFVLHVLSDLEYPSIFCTLETFVWSKCPGLSLSCIQHTDRLPEAIQFIKATFSFESSLGQQLLASNFKL